MSPTYRVADLFCGAGGSSTGAYRAAAELGAEIDLVAVNHWDVAIATHEANHPRARHHCINLDAARPEDLVPDGYLDLLMASPECVYHSRARGGKPINDQLRMSAWHVQRWCSALDVRCILVENVPEFVDWGPVDPATARPIKAKKGLYFEAWVQALWAMGYAVEWRLLNAADFGDATTRTRFFLQARKDGAPIRWPEPTHQRCADGGLFGETRRWRPAREVIDWSKPGRSLMERRRPLSLKTRLRIARGLVKFGGALAPAYLRLLDLPDAELAPLLKSVSGGPARPFVLANRNNNVPRSAEDPLPCATTSTGGGIGRVDPVAEPFVLGQHGGGAPRSVAAPLPTITTDGAIAAVEPLVTEYYGKGEARSVAEPLSTITTHNHFGLCEPLVIPYGPKADARPTDQPLPTIMTRDRLGVAEPTAEPFVLSPQAGGDPSPRLRPVSDPLYTVTASSPLSLVEPVARPFVLSRHSNDTQRSVDEPMPTATTRGAGYLVDPFLTPQFGERAGQLPRVHSVDEPMPAVTSHGAGALVEPVATPCRETIDPRRIVEIEGQPYLLDIRFRMLSPRELARAMGFDADGREYQFTGNVGEQTRQIGNAVAVNTAKALVLAVLG